MAGPSAALTRLFEGNFADYEADKMRRLNTDTIILHRLKYKKFAR